jgi:Fe-S-cluster containining protein
LNELAEKRLGLSETRAVLRKAEESYAAFSCPKSGECCQLAKRKREPWLWRTEWELLLLGLAKEGRPLPPKREDGGCPFLDGAGMRCTVYAHRPFGCRTYFCERRSGPKKEPASTMAELLTRLERSALRFDEGDAPRPLSKWHESPLPGAGEG